MGRALTCHGDAPAWAKAEVIVPTINILARDKDHLHPDVLEWFGARGVQRCVSFYVAPNRQLAIKGDVFDIFIPLSRPHEVIFYFSQNDSIMLTEFKLRFG